MLTVAYCRVSTEEQAEEGFSIEGQAEKLRDYGRLHGLEPVTVVEDPGRSGKDLERSGLKQLLALVHGGQVKNVLVWRLDRLSRNLGDLILLAETFLRADVALHSFTEKLDLSSATGRMFYNILGAFAQFYREQLAENVRMGLHQAVREGRWVNRPKFGYNLADGLLVPNADASTVRHIFALRTEGRSLREIEEKTGVKYSTVRVILGSRIYLGEVLLNGEWFPGLHEALISPEEFVAAHRGYVPRRPRGREVLAGRVRCSSCGRLASVHWARGLPAYRCRHRGQGCHEQPARSAAGLQRAALLGMQLVGRDEELQTAIRRQLFGATPVEEQERATRRRGRLLAELTEKRHKLLDLYYASRISPEGFAEEETRIAAQIEAARAEEKATEEQAFHRNEVAARFEEVSRLLRQIELDQVWSAANDQERRVLVEELLEEISIFPDHLEVKVAGAPRLNILLSEVGLREDNMYFVGVGGGI